MDEAIDTTTPFTDEDYARLVYHRKAGIRTTGTPQEQPFIDLCRRYYAAHPLTAERLAWHEAGHVVIAHRLGYRVIGVVKLSDTHWETKPEQSPPWSKDYYLQAVAGYLAENKACGYGDPCEAAELARDQELRFGHKPSERMAFVEKVEAGASELLDQYWSAVERVAEILLRAGAVVGMDQLELALADVPFGESNS